MHQGNWKCSKCGGKITELPFQPRSESGLTCRTCYGRQKNSAPVQEPEMEVTSEVLDIPDNAELAGEPNPDDGFGFNPTTSPSERPKFSGQWQCALCGTTIASLPFEPRDTSNLKCLDCFKRSKG